MRCQHCAFENPEGIKFCGQCGKALKRVCPQCQFENPLNFNYCGNCATRLLPEGEANTTTAAAAAAMTLVRAAPEHSALTHPEAERRQLTVLFCDVVGSSALSEDTDPEDLRDIMRQYRETCDTVVRRYHGHIAQYLGDGVLIYFGFPHAHEDDARRAAQSGLELISSMTELNKHLREQHGISLEVRIGMHTGLVVVGELGGSDKRSMALGVTPNIAARLQDLAEPNTAIVSSETYRLIRGDFDFIPRGKHTLKGFSRPFDIYQVLQERDRFKPHKLHLTSDQIPLIGREQEAALLLDRLDQARNNAGQIVLLSGEAGIGKSRLAQFVSDQVPDDDCFILQCCGSPYYQNSYLHCVIGVFKRLLDLDGDTSLEQKIAQLEKTLAAFGLPLPETVPLLAELLSLPLPKGRYPEPQLTPQQRKQKTLECLVALTMAMASHKLVFIVVEDLQWIDPTTLDLIDMIIGQAPTSRIFALLTYRMEFTPPWPTRSHLSHISINRLTRKQTGRMVKSIAKNKELPAEIFREIVNKTDGVPFFVEELTRMVLESDVLKETGEFYELNAPLATLAIPSTLQDSLMARLDRLGSEKELAQLSAMLGREFGHTLLKAVATGTAHEFEARLSSLVGSELLYQHGLPPQASYTFRHALVHEVAYHSLLRKTRQQYHQHIAKIILQQFPEMLENSPEIVAHHFSEAGDVDNAIRHWLLAGKTALQRFALIDAVSHLNRGLALIAAVKDGHKAIEHELALQPVLGLTYMMKEGYGSANVEKAYARAYQLCKQIGENSTVVPVLCGLWEYYVVRAELATAAELANQLMVIARRADKNGLYLEAQRALGSTYFWQGDMSEAYKHLERGIDVNTLNTRKNANTHLYGQDTEVATLANAACVLWLLGHPDQALRRAQQTMTLVEQLKHPFSMAYAYLFTAICHQLRGDIAATESFASKTIAVSSRYDFAFWNATGTMLKMWTVLQQHPTNAQLEQFEQALLEYRNTGSRLAHTFFQSLLIDIYLLLDEQEKALATINAAISETETQGVCFFQAELYRLKGVVTAQQQPAQTAAVESLFRQAIDIAQQQHARSLELRSCISLCQHWKTQDRFVEAAALLGKTMNYFSEGYDTRDWKAASTLLQDLQQHIEDPAPVT